MGRETYLSCKPQPLGLLQKVVGDDSILVQPNSIYGLMFYPAALLAAVTDANSLFFAMAVTSCLGSLYLGEAPC